jgi:hypothetical protein
VASSRVWQPYDLLSCEKADCKHWLLGLFGATSGFSGRFDLQQRQPRVIEKDPAGRGQRNAARAAFKQFDPDLQLQVANLPAQRGLRGVQPSFGGRGEAALLGHRNEITQMPQLHRATDTIKVWREHTKSLSKGRGNIN